MATVNLKVVDLSHHNTVDDFDAMYAAGIRGVIHKSSQGTGMVDAQYAPRRQLATDAGLLWGAYHFADGSDAGAQVKHFLSAADLTASDLGALDFEPYPQSEMDLDGARAFLTAYEAARGVKGVLYSGNLIKETLGDDEDAFFGAHRLWLAQYGPAPKIPAAWSKLFLWQYSDSQHGPLPHGVDGITGNVDCNSFDGTDEELATQWPG
jgi:lysozyme